jgi:hypothetical protein
MTMAEQKRFYVGKNSKTGWPVRDRHPFVGVLNRAVAYAPTRRLAQEIACERNRAHHGVALVTLDDLATFLKREGLAMSVRFTQCEWRASIEWSYPDYSTATASGRGETMLGAVALCIADYEKMTRGAA